MLDNHCLWLHSHSLSIGAGELLSLFLRCFVTFICYWGSYHHISWRRACWEPTSTITFTILLPSSACERGPLASRLNLSLCLWSTCLSKLASSSICLSKLRAASSQLSASVTRHCCFGYCGKSLAPLIGVLPAGAMVYLLGWNCAACQDVSFSCWFLDWTCTPECSSRILKSPCPDPADWLACGVQVSRYAPFFESFAGWLGAWGLYGHYS